ncbi:MAG: hypothetical protein P9L92_13200 [Candidatus Electryonea clarkiae]|nr:hypothetical protein [Candidatus Electryonea clarkiae]MDP8289229.1 hypothetical protein [Candidatus Electryonea clarkiae]
MIGFTYSRGHYRLAVILLISLILCFCGILQSLEAKEYVFLSKQRWDETYSEMECWAIPRLKLPDEDSVAVKTTNGFSDSLLVLLEADTTVELSRDILDKDLARLRSSEWYEQEE